MTPARIVARILKSSAWMGLMVPSPVNSPTEGKTRWIFCRLVPFRVADMSVLSVSISVFGPDLRPASFSDH